MRASRRFTDLTRSTSRAHRRSRALSAALLAGLAIALIVTAAALAAPYRTSEQYYAGTRTPGQGAGSVYDHQGCWSNFGSAAAINGDPQDAMTIALIDANGNWRRSQQVILLGSGTLGPIDVRVSPDTLAQAQSYDKKAHCVNSGPTSVYLWCYREFWAGLQCV
jgi:hypothetical protein